MQEKVGRKVKGRRKKKGNTQPTPIIARSSFIQFLVFFVVFGSDEHNSLIPFPPLPHPKENLTDHRSHSRPPAPSTVRAVLRCAQNQTWNQNQNQSQTQNQSQSQSQSQKRKRKRWGTWSGTEVRFGEVHYRRRCWLAVHPLFDVGGDVDDDDGRKRRRMNLVGAREKGLGLKMKRGRWRWRWDRVGGESACRRWVLWAVGRLGEA